MGLSRAFVLFIFDPPMSERTVSSLEDTLVEAVSLQFVGTAKIQLFDLKRSVPSSVFLSPEAFSPDSFPLLIISINALASCCCEASRSLKAVGPPTFFLTFTMNSYWADYLVRNQGRGTCTDSAIGAIIFNTDLSALMKFIQCHEILGKYQRLYGESSIRNEAFHALISFWEPL
jgi:hypothetical protein